LLTILAAVGMPKLIDNQFSVSRDTKTTSQNVYAGYVLSNSPAADIGLKSQDTIIKISRGSSSENITTAQQLRDDLTTWAGQTVKLTYRHNGQILTSSVKLLSDKEVNASLKTDNPKGHLGITPTELQIRRSTWSAPIVAAGFTGQLTKLTVQGLGHAVAGLGFNNRWHCY